MTCRRAGASRLANAAEALSVDRMKLFMIASLFTAALSMFASQGASSASSASAAAYTDNDAVQVGSECEAAGGVCRKSACRGGEAPAPLDCGHDLGCCLPR
jgi:hypothetical protein